MDTVQWLDEKDMAKWDAFVEAHPLGWLCHLSGWKRVIEKSFPHISGHIAAVVDCATGAIQAGLPVYQVKSFLTGNRLVCAPFATLFDPLVSTPEHSRLLMDAACRLQRDTGASSIEVRTLQANELFALPGLEPACAYKMHALELAGTPDQIMRAFDYSNVRQNIRRAAKIPILSYAAETAEHILQFYGLHSANRKRLGLPAIPLRFFQALRDEFAASGRALFLLAGCKDIPVAGLVGLQFKKRLSIDYLSWDREFKGVSPSPFIIWQSIQHGIATGCTVFDFGRTSIHNTGLLKFKRKWGTKEIDLVEYSYPASAGGWSAASRESSLRYAIARHAARIAPGRMYQMFSRFCYRHMG